MNPFPHEVLILEAFPLEEDLKRINRYSKPALKRHTKALVISLKRKDISSIYGTFFELPLINLYQTLKKKLLTSNALSS